MYSKQQISDHLAILKYHLDVLDTQKSYFLYCQCLRLKIIPLIRLIYGEQVQKWIKEKQRYLQEDKQLKIQVISEVKSIFAILQKRLLDAKLLDNDNIQKKISSLNSILAFQPELFIIDHEYNAITKEIRKLDTPKQHQDIWPKPYQNAMAVERLKELCYAIMHLQRKDLIADYVEEFSIIKKYRDEILDDIPTEIKHIHLFNVDKFVLSYFEQLKKEAAFWNGPAGAWEIFCSIEWCWDTDSRDYFRKTLHYKDVEQCENSMRLLNLNLMRSEVTKIKHKKVKCMHISPNKFNAEKDLCENIQTCIKREKQSNNDFINDDSVDVLNHSRIDYCKNLIINKLLQKQELNLSPLFNGPEKIQLYIEGSDLRLKVTWASSIVETYLLNPFHQETGFRLLFFKDLITTPGTPASLSNAQQYLREAGIKGILKKLFIAHVDKNGATLTKASLNLSNLSSAQLKKIRMQIQTFKSLSWDRS